jgi:hypothetical protein
MIARPDVARATPRDAKPPNATAQIFSTQSNERSGTHGIRHERSSKERGDQTGAKSVEQTSSPCFTGDLKMAYGGPKRFARRPSYE